MCEGTEGHPGIEGPPGEPRDFRRRSLAIGDGNTVTFVGRSGEMKKFWFIYQLTPGISPSDHWTWDLVATFGFAHKRDAERFMIALGGNFSEMNSDVFDRPVPVLILTQSYYDQMPFRYNFKDYEERIEVPF
jgi:hypothetical protein